MRYNIDISGIYDLLIPHFHFLLDESNRTVVLRGGAGSGKSYSVVQALVYFILRDINTTRHIILMLRKTSPAARKSIYPLVKQIIDDWGLRPIVKENKTEMSFTFINGSQILMMGLDDEEKLKSIFGVTKVMMEEATEFKLDDYRQIQLRLRGNLNTTFQVFLPFNPISRNSWIFKEFFTDTNDTVLTDLSTYKDNHHLDDEYINTLEMLIDQDTNYYNIYTKGQWGSLGGLIYTKWEVIDQWPKQIDGEIVYGLDFGYEHPSALVRVAQFNQGFVIDELIHQTKLTVADIINKLPGLIKDKSNYIYCDGARPEAIEEICRAGYNARPADKGPGSVKAGLDYCKRHTLYLTAQSDKTIKEIQGYSHKQDKDGNYMDEPVKIFDDGVDSFRYAIHSHFANKINYGIIV